jgi:hypothetical protein
MLVMLILSQLITIIYSQRQSCGQNARILNDTHCACEDYFISPNTTDIRHYPFDQHNITTCSYKQLSLKKTFLLSFFLGPLAIDQMYLGNIGRGVMKLVIPLALIAVGTLLYYQGRNRNKNKVLIIGKVMESLATIVLVAWWVLDWILISGNVYRDQNDLEIFNDF